MPEVRADHPFQLSYEDARLPRSLVVLRAETAEELARFYLEAVVALDGALGQPEPAETGTTAAPAPGVPGTNAAPAPPATAPQGPACPTCGGPTVWKTGKKKDGSPWQAWQCAKGYNTCKGAVWM